MANESLKQHEIVAVETDAALFDILRSINPNTRVASKELGDGNEFYIWDQLHPRDFQTPFEKPATDNWHIGFKVRIGNISYTTLANSGVIGFEGLTINYKIGETQLQTAVNSPWMSEDTKVSVTKDILNWTQACFRENRMVDFPLTVTRPIPKNNYQI